MPAGAHDLFRRAPEKVISRSALGQQVEKGIGVPDPDRAQNIGAAREKRVRQHTDRRPDDRDARPGIGER
jgi:hypothetical protein